jgi:mannose-6-phosphate isomerase-like protein (cupin superfamily)
MRVLRATERSSFSPPNSKVRVTILVGKEPYYGGFEKHTVAIVNIPAGEKLDPHFHKEREESYLVVSGKGKIFVNGKETLIKEGDLVSVLPGERHELCADAKSSLEYIVVTAPAWTIEDIHK